MRWQQLCCKVNTRLQHNKPAGEGCFPHPRTRHRWPVGSGGQFDLCGDMLWFDAIILSCYTSSQTFISSDTADCLKHIWTRRLRWCALNSILLSKNLNTKWSQATQSVIHSLFYRSAIQSQACFHKAGIITTLRSWWRRTTYQRTKMLRRSEWRRQMYSSVLLF